MPTREVSVEIVALEMLEHLEMVLSLHEDGYRLRPHEIEDIKSSVEYAKKLLR